MRKFFYLIKEGIKHIWNNKMMAFASVCVLIFGLLLTGAVALISASVGELVDSVGAKNVVKVYLNNDVTSDEAQEIGNKILAIGNIEKCEFYSKEEAMKNYSEMLGEAYNKFEGDQNPLPDAYNITLKDLSLYDSTIKSVTSIEGVQETSNQRDLADILSSIQSFVNMLGFWVTIILGIISLFIISNTIRMTMYARRFEISIMKSVGATNAFVRTPFVIEGMIIGILSGVAASFLLMVLYDSIMNTLRSFQALENIGSIDLRGYMLYVVLLFVAVGMIVGALAASISIRKYLRKEGNEILGW